MIHPQPTTALLLLTNPPERSPRGVASGRPVARLEHWRGRRLRPVVSMSPASVEPAGSQCVRPASAR